MIHRSQRAPVQLLHSNFLTLAQCTTRTLRNSSSTCGLPSVPSGRLLCFSLVAGTGTGFLGIAANILGKRGMKTVLLTTGFADFFVGCG